MINTKERILNTALVLFNNYGLSQVTLRTIAKEMNISQGNLNYHFKKRDEIIESLYYRLVMSIDESFVKNKQDIISLKMFFDISTDVLNSFYAFRFFFLDYVQIMRENAVIKKHYIELMKLRKVQIMEIFNLLVDKGIMRKEELPNEYLNLYDRFQIIGDFWISSAEVVADEIEKDVIVKYSEILKQTIYPYLTETGKKEYYKFN